MILQIPENSDDIVMGDIFYMVLNIVKGVKQSDFIENASLYNDKVCKWSTEVNRFFLTLFIYSESLSI